MDIEAHWKSFLSDIAFKRNTRNQYAFIGDGIIYQAATVFAIMHARKQTKKHNLVKHATKYRDTFVRNDSMTFFIDYHFPSGFPGHTVGKKTKADIFEAWIGYLMVEVGTVTAVNAALAYCNHIAPSDFMSSPETRYKEIMDKLL